MIKLNPKKIITKRAFTLIELMVSIALFSVVVTVVSGAYLNLLSLDKQAHATNDISTNLNFVVDTMARSIRTGTNYSCNATGSTGGTNCTGGNTSITFTDDQGQTDTFIYNTASGKKEIGECLNIGNATCTSASASYQPLTNPNITINSLMFYVSGVGNSDGLEPYVTFVIVGQINVDSNHAPIQFDIESGADDRVIDI